MTPLDRNGFVVPSEWLLWRLTPCELDLDPDRSIELVLAVFMDGMDVPTSTGTPVDAGGPMSLMVPSSFVPIDMSDGAEGSPTPRAVDAPRRASPWTLSALAI